MARTMLTFRDNVAMLRASREEAQTDALTGLGNRRALARVLERELPRATTAEPLVLVLFDLDGFKHYNDTFGHPAGDALLVRLGGSLAGVPATAAAAAFRMGGDEFCALFTPGGRVADAADRRRRRRALRARRGLRDRLLLRRDRAARRGRATSPRRCASPTSACTRRRTPAARRPAARARTCCCARSPSATPSCAPPPRRRPTSPRRPRCGCASATRRSSRSATPPSCTTSARSPCPTRSSPSPDRSTTGEWAFIRRHTLIGERIIAAAPALTRVAALVRSSHERWDGAGYPDGLAGEDDPARRAHRRRRRRVRRDDQPAPVLDARAPPRRRWTSCAAAPARSSIPRSSTRSPPPGATCASPRPPDSLGPSSSLGRCRCRAHRADVNRPVRGAGRAPHRCRRARPSPRVCRRGARRAGSGRRRGRAACEPRRAARPARRDAAP